MLTMRYLVTIYYLSILILISVVVVLPAYSVEVTVGLLAGNNDLGVVEEAAYEWAEDNFQSTILIADESGKFRNTSGTAIKLDQFAVLWLFHTQTNKLQVPFYATPTQKAIYNYIDSGGGIFLSAVALSYVIDLGIEKGGKARFFQPLGKGPPKIGIMPTNEFKDHQVYEGFDTSKPIFLTSMAQNGFTADFINFKEIPPAGDILGTKTRGGGAGGGERPFVEYESGDGKIITLGHHNGVYTDTKSAESDNLRKLTMNVLNYLGENSTFFSVDPNWKLATTWGKLKSKLN